MKINCLFAEGPEEVYQRPELLSSPNFRASPSAVAAALTRDGPSLIEIAIR